MVQRYNGLANVPKKKGARCMNPLFYCINLFRFDKNVGFEIISVGTAGLEPATSAM